MTPPIGLLLACAVVTTLAASSASAQLGSESRIPDRLGWKEPRPGFPLAWVAARSVQDASELEVTVSPTFARLLASYVKTEGVAEPRCLPAGDLHYSYPSNAPTSLSELIEQAAIVASGRVAALVPGFYAGIPGSLLDVQIETWVRHTGDPPSRLAYFLPMTGTFRAGGTSFCMASDQLPAPPRPGERIWLAVESEPLDEASMILNSVYDGIVVEAAASGGATSLAASRQWAAQVAAIGGEPTVETLLRFSREVLAGTTGR